MPRFIRACGLREPDPPLTEAIPGRRADGTSAWHRAAMKHDVRRMSRDGLRELELPLTEAIPGRRADQTSAWHRAAMKHDVRRMSRDGLRELAQDLFVAGAISLPDRRLLSLEPITLAPHWPDWSTFETSGEAGGSRDWIGEIEARILKGHSEHAYIGYQQLLLSFLKRVEAARREMARAGHPEPRAERPARRDVAFAWPSPTAPRTLTSAMGRPAPT